MGKVYLYEQPNGKWKAQWRDPRTKKQRAKTFGTLKEAEDFGTVTEASMITGTYRDESKGKMPFGVCWEDQFIPKKRVSPKTKAGHKRYGRVNLLPFFENVPLNQVDADMAIDWGQWAEDQFAASTIKEAFVVLRSAMTFAKTKGYVTENHLKGIMGEVVPELNPPREKTILNPDQIKTLATLIQPRFRAMVMTMGMLGLRPGEAIGLRVGDISLLEGHMTVRRSVVCVEGKMTVNKSTKTKKSRTIQLPAPLAEELATHMALYVDTPTEDEALMFPTERTKSFLATTQLRLYVKAAGEKMGVKITSYDLRHSACVNAMQSSKDPEWVSKMLGNSIEVMMKVYNHMTPESSASNMDGLAALYG